MPSTLEIVVAVLLLALAALLLVSWTWIAPQVSSDLDLRVALASLGAAWLGVAWALPRGDRTLVDPDAV